MTQQELLNCGLEVAFEADTHCLVALCASSATVLLTLHPSATV